MAARPPSPAKRWTIRSSPSSCAICRRRRISPAWTWSKPPKTRSVRSSCANSSSRRRSTTRRPTRGPRGRGRRRGDERPSRAFLRPHSANAPRLVRGRRGAAVAALLEFLLLAYVDGPPREDQSSRGLGEPARQEDANGGAARVVAEGSQGAGCKAEGSHC